MSELGLLFMLYTVGVVVLLAEIFIPSAGVLTIAGLGFLVAAVYKTFLYAGHDVGVLAVIACLIIVPTLAYVSVKHWHRTPLGRRISPPNPVVTPADSSVPVEQMNALIGKTGRTVSPLRPVGICAFDGQRISCVAEFGMVEAGVNVEGVAVKGSNLAVVEKKV